MGVLVVCVCVSGGVFGCSLVVVRLWVAVCCVRLVVGLWLACIWLVFGLRLRLACGWLVVWLVVGLWCVGSSLIGLLCLCCAMALFGGFKLI